MTKQHGRLKELHTCKQKWREFYFISFFIVLQILDINLQHKMDKHEVGIKLKSDI